MTDRQGESGGVLRLRNLAMIENIRRAEDPAWRERLEQQQILARLGRMFGRVCVSALAGPGLSSGLPRRLAVTVLARFSPRGSSAESRNLRVCVEPPVPSRYLRNRRAVFPDMNL
jgi:hypothetical protein